MYVTCGSSHMIGLIYFMWGKSNSINIEFIITAKIGYSNVSP